MNTTTELTLSVIICAYTQDRWDWLVQAVESVQKQTRPASEIIVIIDHNPSLLLMAQKQLREIIVSDNRETRGLSGARNSGIALARGEVLAFLDDDAIAAPDWLEQLTQSMHDPQILGTGGAVQPYWAKQKPAWLPEEFYWVVGCTYRGLPDTTAPIRNPIGANMCIRREVFSTIGGFRSGIGRVGTRPVGCEETELCIRARQYWPQRTFLFHPQAQVSHVVPEQRANWRYYRSRCYAEGISKAFVARFVGAKDSLSSESTYTLQTLPTGVLRNIKATLVGRDRAGFARAGAIVMGLLITAIGYVVGCCFAQPTKDEQQLIPMPVVEDTLQATDNMMSNV
ncbi:glycosyl transferase family 2 [Ktedonobacteria bacterium brp13]|nr:glycosyl transferase family 2 [Ktedonobacteria bacterium brp13]